ncbi:MAG: amidase [Gemmatimonadales bacterium]
MPTHDSSDLSRRDFLVLGGAAAAAAALPATSRPAAAAHAQPGAAAVPAAEIEEMTITAMQEAMQAGRETAQRLTRAYLERIGTLNTQGPMLRAVLAANPDALRIAEERDAERRAGRIRGPLHGIPVMVKDNIDTHDRMATTAGSWALEHNIAARDAFIVQRLREAGAVLLGKANLSEWANFRGNRSSSGWSGVGGQCRNPFVLDRSPSGSSAGSGSAVSANLCAAAVGTETDGSIISPSNACGVVGVKPTVGLVSRSGIVPIAHSQDTAGPMTRTVTDAALMLNALAGVDPRDPATAEARSHIAPDYTAFLRSGRLDGLRIGVPRARFLGNAPFQDAVVGNAIAVLRDVGAEVVDPADLATAGQLGRNEIEVLLYEFKADLNAYLATMPAAVPHRTMADLIAFNSANATRELPYFGQELFEQAQEKGPLTEQAYLDARARCIELTRERGIDATMNEHRLDALLGSSGGPAGAIDWVYGERGLGGSSQQPAVSGYPHITVPSGSYLGLPMNVSFYGRAWSEGVLLRIAYAYEQATNARRAPRFQPTIA